MDEEELSDKLRTEATRHKASDHLRAAVVTQLALRSAADVDVTIVGRLNHFIQFAGLPGRGVWLGFAAGVLLTAAIFWIAPWVPRPTGDGTELVSRHVHALGAGPLFEVASGDRHSVKPWFQGKIDFAPEVVDLAGSGFALLGGRVDALNQQPTAALVYSAGKHFISVFERPTGEKRVGPARQQRGFNVVNWSDGVMDIWAISDLESGELERFALAWQEKNSSHAGTDK